METFSYIFILIIPYLITGGITGELIHHLTKRNSLRVLLSLFLYIPALLGTAYLVSIMQCAGADQQVCGWAVGISLWIGVIPGMLTTLFFAQRGDIKH